MAHSAVKNPYLVMPTPGGMEARYPATVRFVRSNWEALAIEEVYRQEVSQADDDIPPVPDGCLVVIEYADETKQVFSPGQPTD